MDQPTPEEEGQAGGAGSGSYHYPAELEQVTTTENRLVLAKALKANAKTSPMKSCYPPKTFARS